MSVRIGITHLNGLVIAGAFNLRWWALDVVCWIELVNAVARHRAMVLRVYVANLYMTASCIVFNGKDRMPRIVEKPALN